LESSSVVLWPSSFFKDFYHDDLFEGRTDVVEDFKRIRALIEGEFE
jgi:hypothetical protein